MGGSENMLSGKFIALNPHVRKKRCKIINQGFYIRKLEKEQYYKHKTSVRKTIIKS